jgi:hypothetical protein
MDEKQCGGAVLFRITGVSVFCIVCFWRAFCDLGGCRLSLFKRREKR